MGVLYCIEPPHMVAIQLKIYFTVGAAIIMVGYIDANGIENKITIKQLILY